MVERTKRSSIEIDPDRWYLLQPNEARTDSERLQEIGALFAERAVAAPDVNLEPITLHLTAKDSNNTVVLSPDVQKNIGGYLLSEDAQDKMNSAKRKKIPDPVLHVLIAYMFNEFGWSKKIARQAGKAALEQIARTNIIYEEEKKPNANILTYQQLTRTANIIDRLKGKSKLLTTLDDPITAAWTGIPIVPVRNGEDKGKDGFDLPVALLGVLGSLKESESKVVLEDWILTQVSHKPDKVIDLLKAVTQFSAYLDSDSFVSLYATSDSNEIPLHPFRALHGAIRSAIATMNQTRVRGFQIYIHELRDIEKTLIQRFHQVVAGPFRRTITATSETLKPKLDDIVIEVAQWLESKRAVGDEYEDLAKYVTVYLEKSGVNVTEFLDLLPSIYMRRDISEIMMALKHEAYNRHLINGKKEKEARNKATKDALKVLTENPWKDAKDLDYHALIKPSTKKIEWYILTGTLGPFTLGHVQFLDSVQEHIKRLDEDSDKDTQRFVIILPIRKVRRLLGYKKEPGDVGTEEERISSALLGLAHADRSKVLISSALQPDPTITGSRSGNLKETQDNLTEAVTENLAMNLRAIQALNIQHNFIEVLGADELMITRDGQLADQQPNKVKKPNLVVGRYGYFVTLLENAEQITHKTASDIVLTTGTPLTSSTKGIRGVFYGMKPPVPLASSDYVSTHWSAARRAERKSNPDGEPLSVTEIQSNLLHELSEMTKQ